MKKGWEIKKLGEVCETGSGGTPLKAHKDYYEGGTIPWLMSGEVSQGEVFEAKNFITEKGLNNSSAKLFPINTVLVAMYGATAGQVGILKFEACTNQAVCGILPNDKTIPEYLFYCFLSKKEELVAQAVGGAQPNISQIKIRNTKIPIPPLPEQQRIVAILDEAFAAIDKAKANAEQNLKNAKELFESYLQGVFENGKEKWEEKLLDEVCEFRNGADHERHIDEDGKYILVNSKFISADGEKFKRTNSALAPLYVNDIAFVMSDVPNGKALAKCFLVDENDTYTLNQRIGAIKPIAFVPEFLVYQLNRNKYLLSFNNGENQTILRKGDILKCPLWVPAKEDQQAIVRQLDALRAETQKLEAVYQKKVADLEELKKSILQKAFAGELRSPEGAEYTNDVATPIAKKKTITSPERA
jgi:type I restriction enzyme S subunit